MVARGRGGSRWRGGRRGGWHWHHGSWHRAADDGWMDDLWCRGWMSRDLFEQMGLFNHWTEEETRAWWQYMSGDPWDDRIEQRLYVAIYAWTWR